MKSSKLKRDLPVRKVAAELISHGYAVCRIEPGEKRPTYPRWGTHFVDPAVLERDDSIGIVCGPISGIEGHALVCIDLDNPDTVRHADAYLPATKMVEGRKGKRRSHRWYLVLLDSIPKSDYSHAKQAAPAMERKYGHPGPRTISFRDREGEELIRLIGTGGQAVVPPSLHTSGARREWENGLRDEPTILKFKVLLKALRRLARKCGWVPKAEADATAGTNTTADRPYRVSTTVDPRLAYRINRYLDEMPASVSGQGGHDACYRAACILVWGFALAEADALKFLRRFNARCQPKWSGPELLHKVREAAIATDHSKVLGHLI